MFDEDLDRLFSEPKPEITFPVDLEAEMRAKAAARKLALRREQAMVRITSFCVMRQGKIQVFRGELT